MAEIAQFEKDKLAREHAHTGHGGHGGHGGHAHAAEAQRIASDQAQRMENGTATLPKPARTAAVTKQPKVLRAEANDEERGRQVGGSAGAAANNDVCTLLLLRVKTYVLFVLFQQIAGFNAT